MIHCLLIIFVVLIDSNIEGRTPAKDDSCPANMFLCPSTKRCIPRSWLCDQEVDCLEGEDEKNCDNPVPQCAENEYACKVTRNGVRMDGGVNQWLSHLSNEGQFLHSCIPIKWRCDGEADCRNKDDEEGCPEIKCGDNHFECKGFDSAVTSCIPKEWVCDGQTDCLDMKDEQNCNATRSITQCDKMSEFKCNDGQCIYQNWVCDGDRDCIDGSDEANCKKEACEQAGKFKCKSNDFCIPASWKCDGEPDCPDHSDERQCKSSELHPHLHPANCSSTEFMCKNGAQCISKFWICDGDDDCFDGSDEVDCPKGKCTTNQKACKNGRCVDENLWCDGADDCQDGTDEKNCTVPVKLPSRNCDPITEHKCDETPTRCVRLKELCDGKSASNDCTKSVCREKIMKCKENDGACVCRDTNVGGKICHCADGYQMSGGVCTDINECDQLGTCDQICINKLGGYQCDCYPGYKLSIPGRGLDKLVPHKCRALGPDPLLLLANRAAIRQYDIVTNKYHPLINKLESAVALDYWHVNNTLVWSDVSKEQIVICNGIAGLGHHAMFESINNVCTGANLIRISEDITTPDGLAIDWVHGLLFWTDTGTDTINVYDFNTKKRAVLINGDGLDEPRAIAVDPSAGLIFWTDWGENARIERAGMDGKNRLVIVKGNTIRWPNGLAVDILDKRLYWADAKTKQISSSDYWGGKIRTILHSHQHLRHPFSLAVFEERLYWTDWDQEGVLSVNKFHGGDVKKLMSGVTGPMTVRVYHQQAQPKHANKCKYSNCEHICLPKALYKGESKEQETALHEMPFSCACERGFKIDIGNASLCVPLNPISAIADAASESFEHIKDDGGFSLSTYLLGLLIVCAAFSLVYIYQQRRPRQFAVLNFDNPIYRRTVEADFDGELGSAPDNSLGPISILHSRRGVPETMLNAQQQPVPSSTSVQDPQAKLVLAVPVQKADTERVDVNDANEYGYDQPPAPKF